MMKDLCFAHLTHHFSVITQMSFGLSSASKNKEQVSLLRRIKVYISWLMTLYHGISKADHLNLGNFGCEI